MAKNRSTRRREAESITGRDSYIMAQGLYWAIKFSQQQPPFLREWSNEQDMKALLTGCFPGFAGAFVEMGLHRLKVVAAERASGSTRHELDLIEAYAIPPNMIDEKRCPSALEVPTSVVAADQYPNIAFPSRAANDASAELSPNHLGTTQPAGPYRNQGPPLFTVETMGRKAFNGFVLDLFGQRGDNTFRGDDLKADRTFDSDDQMVEIFSSREGLIVAIHELHVVHVLRPTRAEEMRNAA